jgi:hypothetical protein
MDDIQTIKYFTRFRTTAKKQPAAFASVLDHFCRLPVFHRVDAASPFNKRSDKPPFTCTYSRVQRSSQVYHLLFHFFATIGLGYKSFFDNRAGHEVQPSMTMVEGAGE